MWGSLNIAKKIWLSISILILGYFVSMLYGFIKGHTSESSLLEVSAYIFPASQESQAALTAFKEQIKLYNDAVLLGDRALVKTGQEKAAEVQRNLSLIVSHRGIRPEKKKRIEAALSNLAAFSQQAQAVYSQMSSSSEEDASATPEEDKNDSDSNISAQAAQLAKQTKELQTILEEFTVEFSDELRASIAVVRSDTKNLRVLNMTMFFIVVIGSSLLIYFLIKKAISLPMKTTVNMIRDIAEGEGDLTKRLQIQSRDEVGDLAQWFNKFIDNLQNMISSIVGNADTLRTSAKELTDLSGLMTDGADHMSRRSDTVAAAAEEMNTNMDSVAAAMEEASTNTEMVATAAEQMTATINEIAQNSEKAASISSEAVKQARNASERVEELGIAAQEVGKVTEAITEIS